MRSFKKSLDSPVTWQNQSTVMISWREMAIIANKEKNYSQLGVILFLGTKEGPTLGGKKRHLGQ
jgi:hypothetical protein